MTVTEVNAATCVSDFIIFLRDRLDANITDPISSSRGTNEDFVLTAYPKMNVRYPIITVIDRDIHQIQKMGMQNEDSLLNLGAEIRIWARNVKERDELMQQVFTYLRTNQFSTDDFRSANLHDFKFESSVNVTELGEEGIKSKVMNYSWIFETGTIV